MAITNNFPTGGSSSIDLRRTLIASFTTAGTYTWTVPEEIKKKGFVDVYIMGGGGSGGAAAQASDNSSYTLAIGGAAGYSTILNNFPLTGKTSINIVVGAGGAAVTAKTSDNVASSSYSYDAQNDYAYGNKGGTSKFENYEAEGGEGGGAKVAFSNNSDSFYRLKGASGGSGSCGIYGGYWLDADITTNLPGSNGADGAFLHDADQTIPEDESDADYIGKGMGKNNVINKYNSGSIMGAAGGIAMARDNGNYNQAQSAIATAYGSSGAGSTNGTGKSATGNGNGGGGTVKVSTSGTTTITATSGAGAPGLVLIYG